MSLPRGTIHLVDTVRGREVHTVAVPPPGLDASGWEAFRNHTFETHRRARLAAEDEALRQEVDR